MARHTSLPMKQRICAAALLGWYVIQLSVLPVMANPVGPTVTAGQATISGLGTSAVTIQQATQQAIINWQQFNIAPNEVTRFIQPNVSAIALNRIFDQSPSQIFGSLQANGNVILLNPNGILFGPNAQVNVGGLIASSLNLTDANFLRGNYLFQGTGIEGWVKNAGSIQAPSGVYLLAPNVENSGIITSPGGNIVLAAGTTAYLSNRPDGRGFLAELSAPTGQAVNLKDLIADGGNITLAGRVVNQAGLIRANSVRQQNGKVELFASESLTLKAGSLTIAKGDQQGISDGGTITAIADKSNANSTATFESGATINVSGGAQGGNAGFVELSAHSVNLGGRFVGNALAGYRGGTLLIDPVDLDLSGLSLFGISNFTASSPDDLRVTGMFDLTQAGTPPGGVGTLTFMAGRDLLFNNVFLFNEGGTSRWNYTGTAGRDIVFTGSNLWTGAGGSINFQAGQDLKLVQDSGGGPLSISNLVTREGGDIILSAGRDLQVPSWFDSTFSFIGGLSLQGAGNLLLTAGRDILGGMINGTHVGPGFVLANGRATVTAGASIPANLTDPTSPYNPNNPYLFRGTGTGNVGTANGYTNITLGTGQISIDAPGNIYLGVVQDLGATEGLATGPAPRLITADPNNSVTLTSTGGNINLNPLVPNYGAGGPSGNFVQSYYPASFSARACASAAPSACAGTANSDAHNINVYSSLTFWPSATGQISFTAYNQIQGVPQISKEPDVTNFFPLFVGYGGVFGGQWQLVDQRTFAQNQTLLFFSQYNHGPGFVPAENPTLGIKWSQPLLAPPMPFTAKDFPKVDRRTNTISVNLIPAAPQSLIGKDAVNLRNADVNTPAQGLLSSSAAPVNFTTTTGDISNLSFNLYSPALPKEISINSGANLHDFSAVISVPKGITGSVKAGGNINLNGPSDNAGDAGGITFVGTGTGLVQAGGNLDLADSSGIQFRLNKFPSFETNQGGFLNIIAGGDVSMTRSRIASYNGASISIHGQGATAVVDAAGKPTMVDAGGNIVASNGEPLALQAGSMIGPDGKQVLTYNGKPVLLNGVPVVLDGAVILSPAESYTIHVGLVEKTGTGNLLTDAGGALVQPVRLTNDAGLGGLPFIWNGKVVLTVNGTILLADAQHVSAVKPLPGQVNVGTNVRVNLPGSDSDPLGILTYRGGGIDIKSSGTVNVNASRIATLGGGDIGITVTSASAAINAGSGAKNEVIPLTLTEKLFNPDGSIIFVEAGCMQLSNTCHQKERTTTFDVPGSGIFTFHPSDPFFRNSDNPLNIPVFNDPEINALLNQAAKLTFFGRDGSALVAQAKQLQDQRELVFNATVKGPYINSLKLGDITLTAHQGSIIIPPAGIRGRNVALNSPSLDFRGGSISGNIQVPPTSALSGNVSFSGNVTGSSTAQSATVTPVSGSSAVGSVSATSAAVSTSSKSSDSVQESVEESSAQQSGGGKQMASKKAEDKEGKGQVAKSVRVKRGVVIQVDVKPQAQ